MADYNRFQENFSKFILSASGFRKVYAYGGDEENNTAQISAEDAAASAIIADVFGSLLSAREGKTIAVGMDARPTGPAIAAVMVKTFSDAGFKIRYTGVAAAPELMAWVKTSEDIDGFAYISASHNPVGHNGFKFGFADGAVLGGGTSKDFISKILAAVVDEDYYSRFHNISNDILDSGFQLPDPSSSKAEAEKAYRIFSKKVITACPDSESQEPILDKLKAAASGIGIVGELNGSARGAGIDKQFFEEIGMKTLFLNDKPGQIVHPIVPEGASLDLCREKLEEAHANNPAFILGYVPDNDGDRGNIVYINERTRCAEILEAQQVFALSVRAELQFIKRINPGAKLAVAVNGPTSMRIERIAEAFGAEVFRSETGEANVVNLAAEKRKEGFEVRILGEGSNGGNITHPASVRDPLNTIFALVKLLVYSGYNSITEAVEDLPAFTTTSAYEPEAKMQIGSISHAELKANYEKIFSDSFDSRKSQLESEYGITGWYEVNYEGTAARKGVGAGFRSGKETGGLKIVLTGSHSGSGVSPESNASGAEIPDDKAFLWMRGSGTEPVFRVMSDIEGDNPEGMRSLLEWHRDIVGQAAGLK